MVMFLAPARTSRKAIRIRPLEPERGSSTLDQQFGASCSTLPGRGALAAAACASGLEHHNEAGKRHGHCCTTHGLDDTVTQALGKLKA